MVRISRERNSSLREQRGPCTLSWAPAWLVNIPDNNNPGLHSHRQFWGADAAHDTHARTHHRRHNRTYGTLCSSARAVAIMLHIIPPAPQ